MKSDQEPITGDNFGGCVLWINFDERTMELRPFDWFGGRPSRGGYQAWAPERGLYEGRRSDRRASYVVVNEETKEARECQLAVGVSSRRLETVEFRTMRIR